MGIIERIEVQERALPMAAELAQGSVTLMDFARKAGKNILSVIPEDTLHETYLRGPGNIHYLCDPEMITQILVGPGRDFPKSAFTRNVIGEAVGNGMILSEGQKWKEQRHRYSPLFAARNLPVISTQFARTGQDTANALLASPGVIDANDLSQEATLTNISRVMFSGVETVAPEDVRAAFREFTDYISNMSLFDLMGLPTWVPRRKWLRSKEPIRRVRALGLDVITARRAKQKLVAEDFLDLMIEALDEDFEDIDTTVDNLLTFVAAGYETSASTLAWGLYLLALNPDVQDALRDEVQTASGDSALEFHALDKMPLLRAHIRETLRLYPAGALFARDAIRDLKLGDVEFKAGDAILLPIYSLHRNTRLWNKPEAYDPERFLGHKPPRGQYMPFGDGPRICIGAQYAETELMMLMGSLIRRVRFGLGDHPVPLPNLTFTMRPGGPLYLTAEGV